MKEEYYYRKEKITLSEKELRNSTPRALLDLAEEMFKITYKRSVELRKTLPKNKVREALLNLEIEYGTWSHNFNKVLRQLTKEAELFQNERMIRLSTILSLIHLIWNKNTRILQSIIGTKEATVIQLGNYAREKTEALNKFNELLGGFK